MSFIIRFICCASAKSVKEEEEKSEEKTGYASPRFGKPQDDEANSPSKTQNQTNQVASHGNLPSEGSQNLEVQLNHSSRKTSESRIAALAREKNLTLNTGKDTKNKTTNEDVRNVHNISIMSIAVEENQEESNKSNRNTGTFAQKSEEEPSLVLSQMRSDPKITNSRPPSVLKGGFVMKKVDRSRGNVSSGLSTENIFQDKSSNKKQTAKRGVLNSTPIMKASTLSTIKPT